MVWDTLKPNWLLYCSNSFLRRVDFPAPEGPHSTRGDGPDIVKLYFVCNLKWRKCLLLQIDKTLQSSTKGEKKTGCSKLVGYFSNDFTK